MRWFALVALACGSLAASSGLACQEATFFFCDGENDCGEEGSCEPNGACSFPDPECPSGRRFGEASVQPFAGECTDQTESTGTTGSMPGTVSSDGTSSTSLGGSTAREDSSSTVGSSTTGQHCPEGWWDCEWSYRRRVSIMASGFGTLSEIPIAVRLGPGRIDHELMQADAEDLRFVSSGGEVLPHEIEIWDPTGVSVVWTPVDVSDSTDDHVWMYYGNPVAESPQQDTNVWSDVYAAVWHLTDGTLDSSANGQHATAVGEIGITPGQLSEGVELLTRSSHLDIPSSPALDNLFTNGATVSAWIRPSGWGENSFGRILDKGSSEAWFFYLSEEGELTLALNFVGESGSTMWTTAPGVIELAAWSHVAATFDLGAKDEPAHVYLNGVEQKLAASPAVPAGGPVPDVGLALAIGNRVNQTRQFEGILDEVRLERTVRTPEWIHVQHQSERDMLLQFGPLEEHE